jgi:hypothetical protein
MPVTIDVDERRQRAEVRARGVVTYDELAGLITQRRALGLLRYACLVDCDGADTDLSGTQVRALADLRRSVYGNEPVAATAVVAHRDVLFGMLRMYEILADDAPLLYVARTCAEAEAWLDRQQGASSASARSTGVL